MSDEAKQGIFGIDLGTTYSAVASIDGAGKPVIARNATGDETTPSVIFFENESNVVIGTVAKETAVVMPDSVVSLIKREMGNADYVRDFFGRDYSAPALSSLILEALAGAAEADSGRKLEQAVITVPAYFGMLEKSATRQAGELAGISVIGIVPEPVAAALAYGLGTDADGKTIFVYDLGGGTFDATVIRMGTDEIRVLTVDGNSRLGGTEWDAALVDHVIDEVTSQLGDDSIREDDAAMQEIWNQAERAKRQLSARDSVPVIVRHSGGSATVTITRSHFEELTKHILDQTLDITKRALATLEEDHPGTTQQISDVLLVGGSSKMPAVRTALKDAFGWDAKLTDPDLAVAKGAALFAAAQWGKIILPVDDDEDATPEAPVLAETEEEKTVALAHAAEETAIPEETLKEMGKRTIISALPKAIGIKLADTTVPGWEQSQETPMYVQHLVPAQTEVPFREPVSVTASTAFANSPRIEVEIWEQAGAVAGRGIDENRFLQRGYITELADLHLPAGSPIELQFTVDGDGIAVATALEPTSGKSVRVEAKIQLLDEEAMQTARDSLSALTATT
jgi:molecular chaperone DnaK (HSP70)